MARALTVVYRPAAGGAKGDRVSEFTVVVDEDLCIGAGQCVLAAPQIFDQDDQGIVILLDATPPPGLHEAARKAAKLCPARAILIEEASP